MSGPATVARLSHMVRQDSDITYASKHCRRWLYGFSDLDKSLNAVHTQVVSNFTPMHACNKAGLGVNFQWT